MVTGCAPFFLLGLAGVALGSWFFGTHGAARFTGLGALVLFVLYFALLNWTAQSRLESRAKENAVPDEDEKEGFREEDRAEWVNYLRTEGRLLWMGVVFLLGVILLLAVKG